MLVVAFGLVALLLATTARAQPAAAPPAMLADAELSAVTFVNADRGWAVGDRGAIWHTADGGRSWKLQASGVNCRLEAVQFLDPENGYAVGGWTQSYTHETHGVVLRTRDGGRTWQNMPDLTLPGLKHARFFDAKSGLAIGNRSSLYPSGVFRTSDGGRTWSPIPKGDSLGWVTGDFRDMRGGAVAGLGGTLGVVLNDEIKPSRTAGLGPRYLRRMALHESSGWLIGDGGLALFSNDGGFTWNPPPGPLPEGTANLDCRALAVRGSHIWIGGAPGTTILHSADGGHTWETHKTGQTLPLSSLHFIDEYRGWAVGALGLILHTRDGGQTWRVQRSGGSRVALLGIFSEPGRVPLELFALQSGSDGYLSAVEIIGRRDWQLATARHRDLLTPARTHEALAAVGGSLAETAWQFPLAEAGLPQTAQNVLDLWNQAHQGQAIEKLEEHLVRQIRLWRPDVIVTEDVSPRGDNPLAHLTNQVALAAVQKAGEATAYGEQTTLAGLEPWKVKKVLALLPGDKQGTLNITPAQWSPRLGRSLAEVASEGRSLLTADVAGAPRNIGLSILIDHLPQQTGRRDVLSGITLNPGGEARRQLAEPPPGDLEQLSRLAQKRHNIEQLLARVDGGGTNLGNWIGQIDDLTRGLAERQSGELLWQLSQRYLAAGRSESAAEAMQLLLEKHARHPLADPAALWLLQYYASSEVAWRHRNQSKHGIRLVTALSEDSPAATQPPPVNGVNGWSAAERAGKAVAIAKHIERTRPILHTDPAARFPLAIALRHTEQSRGAEQLFQGLGSTSATGPWAACAAAEEWLKGSLHRPPKPLVSVVQLAAKPKLDGRLDDPVWQAAKPVSLKCAAPLASEPTTVAMLAYDDEFLYFTASCQKQPGLSYAADNRPRVPDEDFTQQDHLTLLIDLDRDYASYWRLALDSQGRPAESSFGDKTWNPQWYIAAGGDDQWWTVEAAIPLAELAPKKPEVRDVWAVGIQRLVPRFGLQAFNQPASIDVRPEGFGLLVFE